MKLDKVIEEKWPELANNVRLHTSLVTRKKLLKLGWEVMPHPPYSPDLAPSDYEAVKNELIQSFASKNQTFYEIGIMKLTK